MEYDNASKDPFITQLTNLIAIDMIKSLAKNDGDKKLVEDVLNIFVDYGVDCKTAINILTDLAKLEFGKAGD